MKRSIQTTALLMCSFSVVLGATDPTAQELLVTAKQQASLFHNQDSPFNKLARMAWAVLSSGKDYQHQPLQVTAA